MTQKERDACAIVERLARNIGRDCELVFYRDGVQVALLSWSGCVTAPTLALALEEAEAESAEEG